MIYTLSNALFRIIFITVYALTKFCSFFFFRNNSFNNIQTVLRISQFLWVFLFKSIDLFIPTEDLLHAALITTFQVPLLNIRITKCRLSFREGKDPFQINSRSSQRKPRLIREIIPSTMLQLQSYSK